MVYECKDHGLFRKTCMHYVQILKTSKSSKLSS